MLAQLDDYIGNRLRKIKYSGSPITVYGYYPDRDMGETVFPNVAYYRVDYAIREISKRTDHPVFYTVNDLIVEAKNSNPVRITLKELPKVITENSVVRVSGVSGNLAANGVWVVKNLDVDNKTFQIFDVDGNPCIGDGDYIGGGSIELYNPHSGTFGPVMIKSKPFPMPIDVMYEVAVSSTNKGHVDHLNEAIFQIIPPGFQCRVPGCLGIATFDLMQVFVRDERPKPVYRTVHQYNITGLWIERIEELRHAPIVHTDFDMGAE
ncbi:MAG: hypothetical protein ACP5RW_09075 [bacterium]